VEQSLACGGGALPRAQSPTQGQQNPAIQIARRSRKNGGLPTFCGQPCRFDAEVGVTDAGKSASRGPEK